MKNVRIKAKPINTWLGGTCLVPRAFLVNEKTIIILVKDVKSINMLGANVNTVRINKISRVATKSRGCCVGVTWMLIPGIGTSSCENIDEMRKMRKSIVKNLFTFYHPHICAVYF